MTDADIDDDPEPGANASTAQTSSPPSTRYRVLTNGVGCVRC